MGVIQSAYRRKQRNAEDRKRRPIVFLIAEGKNKTETLYFKAFGHDLNRNVRFAPGDYTDPVNMVSTLKKIMADNDFSPELGDKAYCLIDADVDAVKNAQLEKAERLAERFNIQIIVSAPSFEWISGFCRCRSDSSGNTSRRYAPDSAFPAVQRGYPARTCMSRRPPGLPRRGSSP